MPVVLSIPFRDPITAFAPLAGTPMSILLDSARPGAQGRYTYIAADPFRVIRCSLDPWTVTVDGKDVADDPFAAVARELAAFKTTDSGPAPFGGGAVGFFSYELGGVVEKMPKPRSAPAPLDMSVGLYDVIAAFDLERQQAWIVSTGFPEKDGADQTARANARAQWLATQLGTKSLPSPPHVTAAWHAELTRDIYEAKVARIIEAIYAGDFYQANFTQRFSANVPEGVTPYDLYRRLRALAPAPFAAYLNAGEGLQILSASPERFLQVDRAGKVETRPIKGTRPRGNTPEEDARLAEELKASAKDRAENLMIVDLLRNDLARSCGAGSVSVPQLAALETFPAVHHLVSVITGQLRPEKTALALLRDAFPGGSITGAPKIKAMETIHALEPTARGPYCGSIAWAGFDGAMDSSIVIRTLVQTGRTIAAQAGGGIVAQSDPAAEYDESMTKLKPLLAVLGK